MAEAKEYLVQSKENGTVMISEEVIASIAALAVRDVEGVYGTSADASFELNTIFGKKNLGKGIRVNIHDGGVDIVCNLVVKLGNPVMTVAQKVQEAIADEVSMMTGVRPASAHVNVTGVATPKAQN